MTVTLAALARQLGPAATLNIAPGGPDSEEIRIEEIGLDSAALPPGALFAALPGTRTHGAAFAMATPAAAILTDIPGARLLDAAGETRPMLIVADVRKVLGLVSAAIYGYPSQRLHVIGITGTSGKTTTSYLVEAGLRAAGRKVAVIGTTGTRIDGRPVPTALTTPEAPTLQRLFAQMLIEGVTHVVMEVSSHSLALRRVLGTHFEVAGFSNLSQDHLDFHPTMAAYFATKALLFDAASPMRAERSAVCIDDEWGEKMITLAPNTVTVSTRSVGAAVSIGELSIASDGTQEFTLHGPWGQLPVRLPLPGSFNIANAALAMTLIYLLNDPGIDLYLAARGISEVAVPGRMERIDAGQGFLAVVDYAHKPAAIAEVLYTLRAQVHGRVGIVIGAGGNRDSSKRAVMGEQAALGADLVVVTDDNPRDEDPAPIRAAIMAGARAAHATHPVVIEEIPARGAAIDYAVGWARPGDAIIVAGKGHEVGQLIAGVTHHFDDREEVRRALAARGYLSQLD